MTVIAKRLTAETELEWIAQERDLMEVSWAAGFFDGEGSVYWHRRIEKNGHHVNDRDTIAISIAQAYTTEELDRFRHAVGMPEIKILGPQAPRGRGGPVYKFTLTGRRAHLVMQLLSPYLCSKKREKYLYLKAAKGV